MGHKTCYLVWNREKSECPTDRTDNTYMICNSTTNVDKFKKTNVLKSCLWG
jgi:hypothetical protein